MASRLVRANGVTVNDVLDGRKLLEIDCVDRVYLTLSVPNLVVGGQVVNFLTLHEQQPVPSPVLLERRGLAFRRAVTSFAEANDIPVLNFAGKRDKGRPGVLADSPWPERKIDRVMPLMRKAAATGRSQVVAIGVAQEYQRVFTGTKDQTPTGAVWFSYNRTERRVTCYYFYLWDAGFGPAFIKICAYFPYPGKIWVNGHEWAKRQAARAGLPFKELSNGFASCEDPAALAGDLRPARPGPDPGVRRALVGAAAAAVHPRRPRGRLLAGHLHAPGRGRQDHHLHRPAACPGVLRGAGRGQSRHRPTGQHGDHLQPAGPLRHQGRLPHRSRPRQRRRGHQRLLPALPDQDLPQRRPGPAGRDRHQRRLQSAYVRANVCKVVPEVHRLASRMSWTWSAA